MGRLADAIAMMRVKWQMSTVKVKLSPDEAGLRYCYEVLEDVSRSFAMVVIQLNDRPLRDAICIFYLVLRALDTIEDDMSVPKDVKLKELPEFHTHLQDLKWNMTGVGEGRERELLEQYPCVTREYQKLKPVYQEVISDICEKMAHGMCDFLQRPVVTVADYDLYCHYVAGLVGHGLTRIFAGCGFEDPHLADDLTTSNHMGLFLQKTNIIRDYYEDIVEEPPRMFWPKEIWGKYATELKEFTDRAKEPNAVRCLNDMVSNAMTHVPYVIEYMAALQEPSVFRFCAIPQVMAIATLAAVYNNPDTFHVKVKMTKAAACHVMLGCGDLYSTLGLFGEYCQLFLDKLNPEDPSTPQLRENLKNAMKTIDEYRKVRGPSSYVRSLLLRYPGLGGSLLVSVIDSVAKFFGPHAAIADRATTAANKAT